MIIKQLPDLKQFKSLKKDRSPWEKFYDWLVPLLPHNSAMGKVLYNDTIWGIPEGSTIDVTKITLCAEDYKIISELCYKWAKKKLRYYNDTKIKGEVAMLELQIGPREVDSSDTHKPGYVYVDEKYLIKYR